MHLNETHKKFQHQLYGCWFRMQLRFANLAFISNVWFLADHPIFSYRCCNIKGPSFGGRGAQQRQHIRRSLRSRVAGQDQGHRGWAFATGSALIRSWHSGTRETSSSQTVLWQWHLLRLCKVPDSVLEFSDQSFISRVALAKYSRVRVNSDYWSSSIMMNWQGNLGRGSIQATFILCEADPGGQRKDHRWLCQVRCYVSQSPGICVNN